jgi:chromosome segregation protein
MRLKRLELFGFKSFADRTVLEFGEHSLTGIVGPNGCGKSNVVDAIRWVLGETRPTSMRGAEMSDVIFKGSASRPALSVAEVSLVIDNDAGMLEGCGSEVSITRRVFKTGEGEYLIDGDRVRLKDVRNLLFDTGLGSRGYSVLEQGRIDAILSANPLQRRSIFEEAAGISRYRQRRHETDLRLARVLQDTARLEDVLGELRTRVRSLKIQAGKAERYVQVRDEYRTEKTRLYRHRVHRQEAELAAAVPVLSALEERAGVLRGERERIEADAEGREGERDRLLAEVERLSIEAARLEGECRAVDERRSQTHARVEGWRESAEEDRARERVLDVQARERAEALEALGSEVAQLDGGLGNHQEQVGELTGGVKAAVKEYKDARRRTEEQNETVLRLLHRKTDAGNTLRHLEDGVVQARERCDRLAGRCSEADDLVRELEATGDRADEDLARTRTALQTIRERRDGLESELSALEESAGKDRSGVAAIELEEARVSSHVDSLLDREWATADLASGSRSLLQAADAGVGPKLGRALAGLLADHITSRTQDARALDAVLGARAESVVVADAEAARAVAAWLASERDANGGDKNAKDTEEQTRRGQAALTVLAGLGTRRGRRGDEITADGVVGPLADRVEAAAPYTPLVEFLCGDVWLVRDLDVALSCVSAHPDLRFVTPEGELVDAAGLTVGSTEITSGAVGRRARAAELRERLSHLAGELEGARSSLSAAEGLLQQRRDDQAELAKDLERARSEVGQAESAAAAAQARRAGLLAGAEVARAEAEEVKTSLAELESDLEAAGKESQLAEQEFVRENDVLGQLEKDRHRLEEERDRLSVEESLARVGLARSREQREGLLRRLGDMERGLEEARAEIGRTRERAQSQAQSADAGEKDAKQLGDDGARLLEERGSVEERLAELRAQEKAGRAGIDEARHRADDVHRGLEKLGEELSASRLEQQRVELARDEFLRRALEELELDRGAILLGFEPEPELAETTALDELEARVGECKARLDRIGPVNTEAVCELEEVSGRLAFLEEQHGDLTGSRKSLDETLQKIDVETRRLFHETFEEVRSNFQQIFRQLFSGGKADVKLEEGVDVLEAGIEIVAQPPGRKLLPIDLLSGGQRTLTALALLFAVFEARPSPFCVLDEVDAALDDVNIDRFLGMIEGFRKASTQFIIVTHNKGTMTACDCLYGITMETQGVSCHVTVELAEVDKFMPDIVGGDSTREAESVSDREHEVAETLIDAESGEPVVELRPASGAPAQRVSLSPAKTGKAGDGELHATEGEDLAETPASGA